ncbi:MAG TPA: phosphatidate cytidylyltransferase [Pirellulales bacterium]|nr:phosphatidate cytidylyltransferase [Pirellulales bacterium]
MLSWRLLLGVLFAAGLAGLCWADFHAQTPGIWLLPLGLALSALASGEMLRLFASRNLHPLTWPIYLGNAFIFAANYAPKVKGVGEDLGPFGWPMAALALTAIAGFAGELQRYSGPGRVTEQLAATMLSLVYVGIFLSFTIQLRFLDGGVWGIPALVSLVIVVKMCDTGAYTVGRLIGRHKMTPLLSPGKTFEGLAGGLAFACFGSWLAFEKLIPLMIPNASRGAPAWGWLGFGVLVGLAGVVGDLAESLLKRDLGQKDSSGWMPGFGGVLDVLDSVLLAAPVAYLCWALKLV